MDNDSLNSPMQLYRRRGETGSVASLYSIRHSLIVTAHLATSVLFLAYSSIVDDLNESGV